MNCSISHQFFCNTSSTWTASYCPVVKQSLYSWPYIIIRQQNLFQTTSLIVKLLGNWLLLSDDSARYFFFYNQSMFYGIDNFYDIDMFSTWSMHSILCILKTSQPRSIGGGGGFQSSFLKFTYKKLNKWMIMQLPLSSLPPPPLFGGPNKSLKWR